MVYLLLGLIAGLGIGIFIGFRLSKVKYEMIIQSLNDRIQDREKNDESVKREFSLLAHEVLQKHLDTQLQSLAKQNEADLGEKKKEFTFTFEEIKNQLKSTTEKIQTFEKERTENYAKIEKQIQSLSEQERKLITETERLKSALTTSQSVRGRWGELVLRNILAKSDLVQGIDFEEQLETKDQEGSSLKPDFVIKLPQNGSHLVIDSKASIFDSYLESENLSDDASRKKLHQDFAKRLRLRVQDLSSKEYQKHVSKSLPYVILFVPSEAAIRAAFDVDQELFEYGMNRKVFLASPATIVPLILLIAHSWSQYRLSEKAHELSMVVKTLGDRIETFVKRLSRVQGGLDQATRAWNEAIEKSWYGNQGVPKTIEKARELGGQIQIDQDLNLIEHAPRALQDDLKSVPDPAQG